MPSKCTPGVLSESEPDCAPLVGRPTRSHTYHLTCRPPSRKQVEATRTVYVSAETRVALIGKPTEATATQIAYAHRRAISAAVKDLFGNISGAPVLVFDLLKCAEVKPTKVVEVVESADKVERCFRLLISLQKAHVDALVAALSVITAGFCGGEIISLFLSSNAPVHIRASARLLMDVLGVADSPTSLASAC